MQSVLCQGLTPITGKGVLKLKLIYFKTLYYFHLENAHNKMFYCSIKCSGNMINRELAGIELAGKKLLLLIYSMYMQKFVL